MIKAEKETSPSSLPSTSPFTPIDQHLFESRTIFVSGEVNSELAVRVNRQLLAMERADSHSPIVLWIDCPGGEMFSGFSIYDTAQFIRPPVFTVIAGLAASMGSVISLTAKKERRFALPNSKFLIHQPLIAGVMRGSASELEIHAADIIATKKRLHQLYSERTGTPIEVYQELMERDHWIDPKRAVELGMVSKIIRSRDELEAELKHIKA
jgi:ATP-dependent Clp protease protease subunit